MGYLGPTTSYLGLLLVQLSILTTYLTRLPFSKRGRIIAYVLIIISSLNLCTGLIVNIAVQSLDNTTRDNGLRILWCVNGGISFPVDLTIWSLPIPMIMRTGGLNRKKKVRLLVTFSVGLLSCAASLGRLCVAKDAANLGKDRSYNRAYIVILCTAEIGFGACAVSMVPLRPLLRKIRNWYRGTSDTVTFDQRKCSGFVSAKYPGESALERTISNHGDISKTTQHSLGPVDTSNKMTTNHADIELGNITSPYTSTPSAPSPPPSAVVCPGALRTSRSENPGTNRKPSSTWFSGILKTLTTNADRHNSPGEGNNIHTGITISPASFTSVDNSDEAKLRAESTTSLTGREGNQSDKLGLETGTARELSTHSASQSGTLNDHGEPTIIRDT